MRFASPPKMAWLSRTRQRAGRALLEEARGGESAQACAYYGEVVDLAGVSRFCDRSFEAPVAHGVRGVHDVVRVAVGAGVVADAAVAGPWIFSRRYDRRVAVQPGAGAHDESTVDELAARDRLVHALNVVAMRHRAPDPVTAPAHQSSSTPRRTAPPRRARTARRRREPCRRLARASARPPREESGRARRTASRSG